MKLEITKAQLEAANQYLKEQLAHRKAARAAWTDTGSETHKAAYDKFDARVNGACDILNLLDLTVNIKAEDI